MSTMKKIFALTLAIAMVMSVAVFADFTDKNSINAKCVDDVNLLAAIGIINGYTDGSFKPEGTITRAEAAKMIYVLRNGGDDDGAQSWKGAASFSDVASGSWYAGYVAYCAQYNIVAGRSATTFDPNANVTSLELAKMLLVVAGYKADVQGYTGSEWATNVRKDAESAGLLAGYGAALTTAAPRQWAAKMFANTIDAKMAVYYGDMLAINTKDAETVGSNYLGLEPTVTTVVLANENWAIIGVEAEEGNVTFQDEGEINHGTRNKFAVADELVGKEVVVVYRIKNGKADILGVSETGKSVSGAISVTTSGKNDDKYTVKVGSTTLCSAVTEANANKYFDNTQIVYSVIAGTNITEASRVIGPVTSDVDDVIAFVGTNSAEQTSTAYDVDGDDDIDYIVINPVYYDQLATDPADNKVEATWTFDTDPASESKVTVASGLKADDFVKIIPDYASKSIKIEKLNEVVVGNFTATAGDTNEKKIVAGAEYELYSDILGGATNTIDNGLATFFANNKMGKSVTLYTDGKYVVRAELTKANAAALTGKFAYIIDAYGKVAEGNSDDTITTYIKALLSNGTVATLEYDANASGDYITVAGLGATKADGTTQGNNVMGKVFEYKTTSDGKMRLLATPTETTDIAFVNVAGAFNYDKQQIGSYAIDDETYVFVEYKEKNSDTTLSYKVMKATEFKNGMDGKNITLYAVTNESGSIKTARIGVYKTATTIPGTTDTLVVFVTDKVASTRYDAEDEESKSYIKGIDVKTGVSSEFVVKSGLLANNKFFFYEVEEDEGEYAFTKIADGVNGWTLDSVEATNAKAIQLASGEILNFNDDDVFANDVKVYSRSSESVTASTLSAITVAKVDNTNGGVTAKNILIHRDGGKIDIVIFSANAARGVNNGEW